MARSIISDERQCLRCRSTQGLHKHHIFFGTANRTLSEKDGCFCWLCSYHHQMIHTPKTEADRHYADWLKKLTQMKWQRNYNKTKEDFIERYGKSYE